METLPTIKTYLPPKDEFGMLQEIARNAAASGLYSGVGPEQKIFMVLMAARELGVPPMQALNGGIWNIQGKIEISARLMSSMIRRAGHSIIVKICNANECILEGKRADNGDTFAARFSIEDAQRAGLAGRGNWKNYAEDMLYARSMSRLARRLFPDVIGTSYVEGEIRDAKPVSQLEEVEATIVEEHEETIEEKVTIMMQFCNDYPDEDANLIGTYLKKYADHYKKRMKWVVNNYSDREKFLSDFNKWKDKEEAKKSQ